MRLAPFALVLATAALVSVQAKKKVRLMHFCRAQRTCWIFWLFLQPKITSKVFFDVEVDGEPAGMSTRQFL